MATLHVRNFPDALYQEVQSLALQNGRSLTAEVVVLVDQALRGRATAANREQALRSIARRRSALVPGGADSLSLLREDRER